MRTNESKKMQMQKTKMENTEKRNNSGKKSNTSKEKLMLRRLNLTGKRPWGHWHYFNE